MVKVQACLERNLPEKKETTFLTRLEHSLCPLQQGKQISAHAQ
jgi:hypothetical protein